MVHDFKSGYSSGSSGLRSYRQTEVNMPAAERAYINHQFVGFPLTKNHHQRMHKQQLSQQKVVKNKDPFAQGLGRHYRAETLENIEEYYNYNNKNSKIELIESEQRQIPDSKYKQSQKASVFSQPKKSYQLNEIKDGDRSPFIKSLKQKTQKQREMNDETQFSILKEIEEINDRVGADIGNSYKRTLQREQIEKQFQYMNSKFMVNIPDSKVLLPVIKSNEMFKSGAEAKVKRLGSPFITDSMLPEINNIHSKLELIK